MPHYTAFSYLGLIALGIGLGSYGTLIGAGGGFLLMPLLLFMYPQEHHHTLTAISLAVVFLNSISGTGAYARLERIDYKSGLLFAAASIPGAVLGVLVTGAVPRSGFEAIFGSFLIGMALFLLLKPKKGGPSAVPKTGTPRRWQSLISKSSGDVIFEYGYNPLLGATLFFFLGFAASFLGIGGGSLVVPILAFVLNFPVFIATGTSQFIVSIITLAASLVHVWHGSFHHGAHRIAALGIGVLIGAQIGASLSNKIKGAWVIRGLALAVGIVGLKMLIALFY
jgi:uncharacterized protein